MAGDVDECGGNRECMDRTVVSGLGVSCVVRIYGERLRGAGVMLWCGRCLEEARLGGGGGGGGGGRKEGRKEGPSHPSKEHAHKSSPWPRCSTASPSRRAIPDLIKIYKRTLYYFITKAKKPIKID